MGFQSRLAIVDYGNTAEIHKQTSRSTISCILVWACAQFNEKIPRAESPLVLACSRVQLEQRSIHSRQPRTKWQDSDLWWNASSLDIARDLNLGGEHTNRDHKPAVQHCRWWPIDSHVCGNKSVRDFCSSGCDTREAPINQGRSLMALIMCLAYGKLIPSTETTIAVRFHTEHIHVYDCLTIVIG